MTWSIKRRLIGIAIIAGAILTIAGGVGYFTIYHAPSCTDGTQNQSEEGVDCGGSCPYLCTISQSAPSVRFARALSPSPGRTDVIAYIDNPNTASRADAVSYTIDLYSDTNVLIARKEGVTDLPPNTTVPIFVPNFFSGSQSVAHTFLSFNTTTIRWFTATQTSVRPTIDTVNLTQDGYPRVTARVVNPTPEAMQQVHLVATLFGTDGNAMAASATIVSSVPAQGSAQAVFTWPTLFTQQVSRIEVVPLASGN